MPKLSSSLQIVKVLLRKGFLFISQKGSHAKYRKEGKAVLTVIVPMARKEIPYGTFRSILRQANLNEEEFKK
jgi:predicted RNA binding protein YcfA (HicA-like mRNA interferase family)